MKRLTTSQIQTIYTALCQGNHRPLQKLIRQLKTDGIYRRWETEECLLRNGLEDFLLRHDHIQEAQALIRAVGFDQLLDIPDHFPHALCTLVEKGTEEFVTEVLSYLEDSLILGYLTPEESDLLLRAAQTALHLQKEPVTLQIYRVALAHEVLFSGRKTHPLVHAARTRNPLLAQAYRQIYPEKLKYISYDSGYLDALVQHQDPAYLEIALACGGNVHAPTNTGESLLDRATSPQTRQLLLQHGAEPTKPKLRLLRQAILALEQGAVDHQVMAAIFSYPEPLLCYSFYENTYPSAEKITWDLLFAAAKHRSVPALRYLLPYLHDDRLTTLLCAILDVDTVATVPRRAQQAEEVIAVLDLLIDNNISYRDPWKMDDEDYQMTMSLNNKAALILNLSCFQPTDTDFSDQYLVEIAMRLWKIGNLYGTAEGAREMLLLGLNQGEQCLLDACLATFEHDFSLLDTDRTTAVWNVISSELLEEAQIAQLLQYVLDNGAQLNHQTGDGRSALHAAYQYNNHTGVKLLLEAGADRNIRDNQGRKPKQMPREEFQFLSLH